MTDLNQTPPSPVHALALLPRRHWIALGLTCLFVAALLILIPVKNELERQTYAFQVPMPESSALEKTQEPQWEMRDVSAGNTLAQLFQDQNLSPRTLFLLTQTEHGRELSRILPTDRVGFQIDGDSQLTGFRLERTLFEAYEFQLQEGQFRSEHILQKPDIHERFAQGTISSSLFEAGIEAGMSNSLIMELATIFGWDVDFALDIREGDTFSLIYQEQYHKGEKVGDGDILVARFTNQDRTYTAVRYEDNNGYAQYYSPEGLSMRKAFLRSPVDFARISSRFNLKRRHPILHKIRAHKGVDYAASRGTPIRAAGDGKVIFAGRKGGYGKTLILQHGTQYTTLYAHLENFRRGISYGKRVKQGQVIGYVGSSGLASGPHLHYEFRVNNQHRDPLKVRLPQAEPIENQRKENFLHYAQVMVMRLESHLFGDHFAMR